jgi:anti-sigma factor RsiW
MNRQQVRENLPLYADGELDPQGTAELERHLAESAELRDELERWRSLRGCAHRVVVAHPVPAELENTVRQALRRWQLTQRRRPLRLFAGITAIAAAIVLVFLVWPPAATAPEPKRLTAERFAEIYLHCAVERRHRQVEVDLQNVNAAQDTLAKLVTYPVLVPDLQDDGFELDGVCRCFREPGVAVVHAFYRRGAPQPAVLSFFSVDQKVHLENCTCEACAGPSGRPREYEFAACKGVMVCKWDETENSFALCSEMNREELRDLAEAVKVAFLPEPRRILAWAKPQLDRFP